MQRTRLLLFLCPAILCTIAGSQIRISESLGGNNAAGGFYLAYGYSVAGAGDVNRDGFLDAIVSAPTFYMGASSPYPFDRGDRVYIHFGGLNGMHQVPDVMLSNMSPRYTCEAPRVAGAGDVNKDGCADIIVGVPDQWSEYFEGDGAVYVFFGRKDMQEGANQPLVLHAPGDQGHRPWFGTSVVGVGDVNGDDTADVAVGEPGTPEVPNVSFVHIYYGGKSMDGNADVVVQVIRPAGEEGVGWHIDGGGNVNGDRFDDIVVGGFSGKALILFGGSPMDTTPDMVLNVPWGGSCVGRNDVSIGGDVNGDGIDDILVGTEEGDRVALFLGAGITPNLSSPLDTALTLSVEGSNQVGMRFGYSVDLADFVGDNNADIIIGAPGGIIAPHQTVEYPGRVYVFSGGPIASMSRQPSLILAGNKDKGLFGHDVQGAGDLNNDSKADILVGNPYAGWGDPVAGFGAAHTIYGVSNLEAKWVAYNDFGWMDGQGGTYITKITSPNNTAGLPSSGNLIDHATGVQKLPELSVTGGMYVGDFGADAKAGDAASMFNDIVSCIGYVGYDTEARANSVVVRLSHLHPTSKYEVVLFGNRNEPSYEWVRRTKVVISGADSFVNTSSVAVDNHILYTGTDCAWTNLPSYTTETGYVARFADIDPGDDGEITFTLDFDGDQLFAGQSRYLNALRLTEKGLPQPNMIQMSPVGAGPEQPRWVAYNDLAWAPDQKLLNITGFTMGMSGHLRRFGDGGATDVNLAVGVGGRVDSLTGAHPTGGDAATFFNSSVIDCKGVIRCNDYQPLTLTFSGMNPQARYTLVFYGNRDSYSWIRASLVTISGTEGFQNESSSGYDTIPTVKLFSNPASPSTRLPAGNTDWGYVARFTNVRSGSDSTVSLSISPQNYDGTPGEGGYASALRVEEYGGTAPRPKPLRFVVTGDSRGTGSDVNWTALEEIAHAVVDEDPDFVLFPGDLVNGYASDLQDQFKNWKKAIQPLIDAGRPVYPIRGNHDTAWAYLDPAADPGGALAKEAWRAEFSYLPSNTDPYEDKITYSFVARASPANAAFIVGLDQHGRVENDTFKLSWRQEWLEAQLNANTLGAVFVFGHYPAFKISDRADPDPMLEGLYADTTKRNEFWRSLSRHGVRAYFCAHSHYYDHSRIVDKFDADTNHFVHQFIVGTAGSPYHEGWNPVTNDLNYVTSNVKHQDSTLGYTSVQKEKVLGYVVVEVDSPWVTMTWKYKTANNTFEHGGDVFRYKYGAAAGSLLQESARNPDESPLYQNYPNPFNPASEIRYQVSEVGHVRLVVYDLLGRQVATLVNERKEPGMYQVRFEPTGLASGVYFCRLTAGEHTALKKMLLLR
jgi:hypothetical protein